MKIFSLTLVFLLAFQQLISMTYTQNTETPEYKVIQTLGDVEIRHYPGLVLASTSMGQGSYSGSSGNGFRTVAGYIFGGNSANEKISMTSPVMVQMSDTMTMSFVMPSGYSLDNLPDPDDPSVYLHEEPSRVVAAIRYGGFNNDSRFEEYRKKLSDILEKNGITAIGPYMFYGYNAPYELVNRRNEIVVEVRWSNSAGDATSGE